MVSRSYNVTVFACHIMKVKVFILRTILQLTLLASMCKYSGDTNSNAQYVEATSKHAACWKHGWQNINFINSEHARHIDTDSWFFLEHLALSQSQSLRCFLSCWVVRNNTRTEPYLRLEKHTDDSHHRKSSVGDFSIELLGFLSWVRSGQHLESKVSSIRISSWGLFLGDFAESHVGQDLTPSSRVGILGL